MTASAEKDWFVSNLEAAWLSCWLRGPSHHPGLERLPPRLWEPFRQKLQAIYREATGEEIAVLSITEIEDKRP